MRLLRLLVLTCVVLGLSVQAPAQAVSAPDPVAAADCADMAPSTDGSEPHKKAGCCDELGPRRLSGMSCATALAVPDLGSPGHFLPRGESVYAVGATVGGAGVSAGPEPPPPQIAS